MRAFLQVAALVTRDVDQVQKMLDVDESIDDTSATSSTYFSSDFTIAPSATSFQIPFGGVTAAATVIILAYDEVQVQLDSNTAPLVPVRPTPAVQSGSLTFSAFQQSDQPGIVFWRGKVTSIFVSNPSSVNPADFIVILIGEAT